jgi:hypothetical protein
MFLILVVFIVGIVLSDQAQAYLDPGTGSYVFQVAAAFIFGGLLLLKQFWNRIKSVFSAKPKEKLNDDAD